VLVNRITSIKTTVTKLVTSHNYLVDTLSDVALSIVGKEVTL